MVAVSPVNDPIICGVCFARNYLAETPNVPPGCHSLVFLAAMYSVYKSNVPFIDRENVI